MRSSLGPVASLVLVTSCSQIWGMQPLTLAPDASEDGAGDDGGGEGDAATDALDGQTTPEAAADARVMDAGRDVAETEVATDSGPDMNACAAHCTGCCDSEGGCITPTTRLACGPPGAACIVCPTTSCIGGPACCGATTGMCGCSALGVVCSAQ
jgi:hypothetical protein